MIGEKYYHSSIPVVSQYSPSTIPVVSQYYPSSINGPTTD